MPHPVLIAAAVPPSVIESAKARFDARIEAEAAVDMDKVVDAAIAHQAQAVVIGSRTKVEAAHFARLPKSVKVLATNSVGYDHLDLPGAKAAGLMLTNTPDVLTNATADLTLFLMLGALRRGKEYLEIMAAGWRKRIGFDEMLGMEVGARTLGIVGMGRIGQAVARRAKAFGMPIIYHNRNRLPPEQEAGAIYFPTLDGLLAEAQVLCLTAPAAGSKPLIGEREIGLLPFGAVLVNTGRGALVDEDAMIAALESGQLAAAGLDVFKGEPVYDLRLRELPNAFMTPHMGSATLETRTAMGMRALENVELVLNGEPPRDLIPN